MTQAERSSLFHCPRVLLSNSFACFDTTPHLRQVGGGGGSPNRQLSVCDADLTRRSAAFLNLDLDMRFAFVLCALSHCPVHREENHTKE